eukprot:2267583-Rhodomonas_salina.2
MSQSLTHFTENLYTGTVTVTTATELQYRPGPPDSSGPSTGIEHSIDQYGNRDVMNVLSESGTAPGLVCTP